MCLLLCIGLSLSLLHYIQVHRRDTRQDEEPTATTVSIQSPMSSNRKLSPSVLAPSLLGVGFSRRCGMLLAVGLRKRSSFSVSNKALKEMEEMAHACMLNTKTKERAARK